jgi:DNA 3'-phosphatase
MVSLSHHRRTVNLNILLCYTMAQLQLFDDYAIYGPTEIASGRLLFGFDLDHTIIKPRVGTFYTATTDWVFVGGMEERLKNLYAQCGRVGTIAVFTNQGGVAAGKVTIAEVIARIDAVMKKLGFTFMAFIALSERYRKPGPLMFHELIYGYMPEFERGFYCGDASGGDDFSDSDLRFALNTGLKYITVGAFTSARVDVCDATIAAFDIMPPIPPPVRPPVRQYITRAVTVYPEMPAHAVVLMVGPPGCGKSTYAAHLAGIVVSRDTLSNGHATAAQCLSAVRKIAVAKIKEKSQALIVVDATHPDVKSRAGFIKLASSLGMAAIAIVVNIPIEVAKHMNRARTLVLGSHVPDIAYGMFAKRYEFPTVAEGFAQVITIDHLTQNLNLIPDDYLDMYL